MGLLSLQRLMSLQRDRQRRRRRRAQTLNKPLPSLSNGPIASSSVGKRKGSSCQHQGAYVHCRAAKRKRCSIPSLPEDIWFHIHSLLPLRDAARAAGVSRSFLRSWRCHPNLNLNWHSLGSNANATRKNSSYISIIDNILRKHSGSHIKTLNLKLYGIYDSNKYLGRWLQVAVMPGIEELTIEPYHNRVQMKHNVPCTVLSDGVRNSIRCLQLSFCAFHPTADLGPLRNLTSLSLQAVHILDDELECFLSNSPALEQLAVYGCSEIVCMRGPCVLLQLHCLEVRCCLNLRVLENKARNLSSFHLYSVWDVKVSLGETLQLKNIGMSHSNLICYARANFPSNMPKLESLSISSYSEMVDTPMLPSKFLFLKHLHIYLLWGCPGYDYFSLVSFLDASPYLENLLLNVSQGKMQHESVFDGSSQLRQMPEQHHGCLKSVKFIGFSSDKSLVELTCYILKNAKSLGCLTLDTTYDIPKCDNTIMTGGMCPPMRKGFLMEARRWVAAIRTYIEDKVPSTVKLTVVEHCTRCHADTLSIV